jgi:hypothetical protein
VSALVRSEVEVVYKPYLRLSFWTRAVDSRNNVSLGGSLWKTTLDIDDFPLLPGMSIIQTVKNKPHILTPSLTSSDPSTITLASPWYVQPSGQVP